MIVDEIRTELYRLQDGKYRDFQSKLIPTVAPGTFIGVRTPELRKLAKRLGRREDAGDFLSDLPHRYFDENQLHAFLISDYAGFDTALRAVERFLPYVDNWATCDQMSPKGFKKRPRDLLPSVRRWLDSDRTYTVRFGVKVLMDRFLDGEFDGAHLESVAALRSEEYYVRMMVAWYFATALAKQYDAALPYLEAHRLDPWTHRKTIQKALESYRVPPERKEYLRSLK